MARKPNQAFVLTESDVPLIDGMSGDFAQILIAADSNGCNYLAISADLGIPLGTVKSRLNRARRKLIALREAGAQKEAA